jgi:TDG/mug DNA glycosylase family protein
LRPGLRLVFVGYNPSTVAWRAGHYYANPVNHFYRLLHRHGLTPTLLAPAQDAALLDLGIGVCDLVAGLPSPQAGDLAATVYRRAVGHLTARLQAVRPRLVCCNGIGVGRFLLGREAKVGGWSATEVAGARVFVVPSTSGAANGQWAARERAFAELAAAVRAS